MMYNLYKTFRNILYPGTTTKQSLFSNYSIDGEDYCTDIYLKNIQNINSELAVHVDIMNIEIVYAKFS